MPGSVGGLVAPRGPLYLKNNNHRDSANFLNDR